MCAVISRLLDRRVRGSFLFRSRVGRYIYTTECVLLIFARKACQAGANTADLEASPFYSTSLYYAIRFNRRGRQLLFIRRLSSSTCATKSTAARSLRLPRGPHERPTRLSELHSGAHLHCSRECHIVSVHGTRGQWVSANASSRSSNETPCPCQASPSLD
jgi:hypothetical protein